MQMNDDLTVILIESINLNPVLTPERKLELIAQTMKDCKQKKIGKIITDAIESRSTKKRGRGRPKKESTIKRERTENEERMIQIAKEGQSF